ncbi:acyltransferase family protein [Antarcticimicrobium luteum]|uniref:acyltransferase family protein n=1 Tax=Antarcticimicrobium luteum TaxID=2547397 RepID=UPI001408B677|nr:acyltransferase [Antarcticimicrobium luteum]
MTSGHIPSLDGFRAVSILVVFASHVGFGDTVPGGFGVTVFFFISGFLITTLLCRETDRYGRISFRAFYARRVLRLMPPLLCALGLSYLLLATGIAIGGFDWTTLISQIFFFFNYLYIYGQSETVLGLGVLWSLSVEEHFYILWPLVFLVFAGPVRRLRWIWPLILVFTLWRAVHYWGLGTGFEGIYYLSDTRLDSLLVGCALALLMWRDRIPVRAGRPVVMASVLALSFAALLVSFLWRDPAFRSVLRYAVQGLALMPIFYYAVTRPDLWLFRPLNWGWMQRIGVYSYSIYLIHLVLIRTMDFGAFAGTGMLWKVICAGGLSVLYAAAIHQLVERPLLPLRRRITGHLPVPR